MADRIINPSRFQMPVESVNVEFDDSRSGKRVTKTFPNALAARRFWLSKDAAGKNPKIRKPSASKPEPSQPAIGIYMRVSSEHQSTLSQEPDLKRWADAQSSPVIWFTDKATGKNFNRPGWAKLEEAIRTGKVNSVCVWRLDRLGRTCRGLTALIAELRERKCGLISLKDGFDLNTSAGRLMGHIFSSISEYEVEVKSERARAGIAAAKASGKRWGGSKPGRRKASDVQIAMVKRMYDEGKTPILQIAKAVALSRGTVYSIIRS